VIRGFKAHDDKVFPQSLAQSSSAEWQSSRIGTEAEALHSILRTRASLV
jgi:hypothetical protein